MVTWQRGWQWAGLLGCACGDVVVVVGGVIEQR